MNRLATAYKWVLILPTLLPLFYLEGMMYPLMTPKTLALRAFAIIALALFAYLSFEGYRFFWGRLRPWYAWLPAGLLGIAYVASYFGVDFYHSFWSTFERGDGLFTLTACIGYFYLIVLSVEASWLQKFLKATAWVGTLSAVYLVLQWLSVSGVVDLPFIVKANGRIGGAMGNAAFLASYLGMAFFATLAALSQYQGTLKRLLISGAALQLFAIALTGTRGTYVALLAVGGIALIYQAIRAEGRMRTYARSGIVIVLCVAALFFVFREQIAQSSFTPLKRLAAISLSDSTVASRLFIWQTVSKEAFSRPLLGYGAEHIDVPFDRVYDPSAIQEEWFDRSHNAYLDYFVQFGILGALLYMGLIALVLGIGFSLWRAGERVGMYILGIGSVYAIQNFFVFDTAITLWFLLVLAGAAVAYRFSSTETSSAVAQPRPIFGAFVGVLVALFVIPGIVQPLRANLLAFESYQYQIADVARSNATAQESLALGTYADLELGYNAFFMYTEQQLRQLKGKDLEAAYENAAGLLEHSSARYPYDARTAVYLAQVLSSAPSGVAVDSGLLSDALTRALKESPKRAQPWYILTNLSLADANAYPVGSVKRTEGYAAAHDLLTRYIALVPNLAKPWFVLAQLEYAAGDPKAAAASAANGKVRYIEDLETARRAAMYYETVLNLPDAAYFLAEIVRIDPSDTAAASDLAQIKAYDANN